MDFGFSVFDLGISQAPTEPVEANPFSSHEPRKVPFDAFRSPVQEGGGPQAKPDCNYALKAMPVYMHIYIYLYIIYIYT